MDRTSSPVEGKVILITGGTGSFGRAFIRMLLEHHRPSKVIVFSRDEWKQWEMRRSDPLFDDSRMRYFLGDVRDKERLLGAFRGVDIVVHAAALKHIPLAEYNPAEYIKTNIMGAMNVIDAAVERSVEKVVALSTDKAVSPANLYGATKLCSDKLFVAANVYSGKCRKPLLSVVRYGNVLGSRGSIIPMWMKMIDEGATSIPVTDERMTRFWITLPEAARFVMTALGDMNGAEIFVPKIPSMTVVDLAKAVAPHASFDMCGIRPGEKLHEVMIGSEDARNTYDCNDYYVIVPQTKTPSKGTRVPEGFVYSSHTNDRWLSADELKKGLVSHY